ncbi:hypothetical protein K469DRAFT_698470 [Zopfia rhizophila CBS 207.26]|uniref:Mid2 domain-containing protein n=1 Tax=Zopfia rhizophila CBS 207.26 TaxID=1314779 RepID=A0A6A6EXP7_9PEZI|nr:hypothetical protein K469DRAFT_698470 [Zopfia rhizophila CBS 207.26]
MFPWRTVLSIVTVAFVFAFLASDLTHRRTVQTSKQIRKNHDTGAALNAFGARPPFAKDQLEYDSRLHKRDVCNNTFPGRYSQTCQPSNTLCCIIPGASRPACVGILGFGFCCTEHTDCFVDTKSVCDESGSTRCGEGSCCPANTNCVNNFNYTSGKLVRCNVDRNLIPGYTASSSSRTASRTASATASDSSGTATSITAGATSAVPASEGGDGPGLSGGAIAGIVVGALGVIAIGAVAGWFVFRRKQKKDAAGAAMQPAPYNPYPGQPQETGHNEMYEAPAGGYYNQPKERYAHAEMAGEVQRQELP